MIENGFYYDFFRNEPFSVEDFAAIEKLTGTPVPRRGASTHRPKSWPTSMASKSLLKFHQALRGHCATQYVACTAESVRRCAQGTPLRPRPT